MSEDSVARTVCMRCGETIEEDSFLAIPYCYHCQVERIREHPSYAELTSKPLVITSLLVAATAVLAIAIPLAIILFF